MATIEEAEKIAGRRLDRRRRYEVIRGVVCKQYKWTRECTGCEGIGCLECGYQGRCRESHWCEIDFRDYKD